MKLWIAKHPDRKVPIGEIKQILVAAETKEEVPGMIAEAAGGIPVELFSKWKVQPFDPAKVTKGVVVVEKNS